MEPQVLAVLAGVTRYLEEEEESKVTKAAAAPGAASAWALHGRQGIMRMRELVQRRVLKR
jgi:hypothetical protein